MNIIVFISQCTCPRTCVRNIAGVKLLGPTLFVSLAFTNDAKLSSKVVVLIETPTTVCENSATLHHTKALVLSHHCGMYRAIII